MKEPFSRIYPFLYENKKELREFICYCGGILPKIPKKRTRKITPKKEKEGLYGLIHQLVSMFQQISVKNSSAYWVNISQKRISFIDCSNVIMSRLVIVLYLTLKV